MNLRASQMEKGFALLLSLIVSSVVLAIGLVILEISVNQINLAATSRESEFAFQSAHAGVDCIWYWRYEFPNEFTAASGASPDIECFGTEPIEVPAPDVLQSDASGHARAFYYTFEWGEPERCTAIDMYVLNAHSGDLTVNFANQAIGNNGSKMCEEGNLCTVIVSGGYNRPCDELGSGVFAVQREITVEF